jgi:hypothetical protein
MPVGDAEVLPGRTESGYGGLGVDLAVRLRCCSLQGEIELCALRLTAVGPADGLHDITFGKSLGPNNRSSAISPWRSLLLSYSDLLLVA